MEQKDIINEKIEIKENKDQIIEKDYYTKKEVDDMLAKKIVEYLGSFLKKNDEPKNEKIETNTLKQEDNYEW